MDRLPLCSLCKHLPHCAPVENSGVVLGENECSAQGWEGAPHKQAIVRKEREAEFVSLSWSHWWTGTNWADPGHEAVGEHGCV